MCSSDLEEEARLVHYSIACRIDLTDKFTLLIDMGGGSVEVTLCDDSEVISAQSFKIGTVRLLEMLSACGDFNSLLSEYLDGTRKKLREQMQLEITRLHKKLGFTVIYVTHDQTEALTMSDRIAVFDDGIVQQCDAPDVLYEQPANAFVADFIGENNFMPGTVTGHDGDTVRVKISTGQEIMTRRADCDTVGSPCKVAVRPEKLFILPSDHAYDNTITATFSVRLYVGDFIRYFFDLPDGTEIVVKVLNDHAAPKFAEGQQATLISRTHDCFAFAAK